MELIDGIKFLWCLLNNLTYALIPYQKIEDCVLEEDEFNDELSADDGGIPICLIDAVSLSETDYLNHFNHILCDVAVHLKMN